MGGGGGGGGGGALDIYGLGGGTYGGGSIVGLLLRIFTSLVKEAIVSSNSLTL